MDVMEAFEHRDAYLRRTGNDHAGVLTAHMQFCDESIIHIGEKCAEANAEKRQLNRHEVSIIRRMITPPPGAVSAPKPPQK